MSDLPPAYNEAAGSSSGRPPAHSSSGAHDHDHPDAAHEKAKLAQHHAALAKGTADDRRLIIWHAPTGNSLITAADECVKWLR